MDLPPMGQPSGGHFCVPSQCQDIPLLHEVSSQKFGGSGCPHPTMKLPSGICISSDASDSEVSLTTNRRTGNNPGGNPLLARKTLVYSAVQALPLQPLNNSGHTQPSVPGKPLPSTSRCFEGFEGLEVEQERLEKLGCSHRVIQTLLQARKAYSQ